MFAARSLIVPSVAKRSTKLLSIFKTPCNITNFYSYRLTVHTKLKTIWCTCFDTVWLILIKSRISLCARADVVSVTEAKTTWDCSAPTANCCRWARAAVIVGNITMDQTQFNEPLHPSRVNWAALCRMPATHSIIQALLLIYYMTWYSLSPMKCMYFLCNINLIYLHLASTAEITAV